jgi:site-specific recombinase XerD
MNLRLVILPLKVLADGTHKLRIAVSHNTQTRYIPTRFTVPSTKNLKNGSVVGVPNAQYINMQIRTRMNEYYRICDEVDNIEYYTCAQLVKLLTKKDDKDNNLKTVEQISEDLLKNKEHTWSASTVVGFKQGIRRFIECFGKDFVLVTLTHDNVLEFHKFLAGLGFSQTSIGMRMASIKRLVKYAIRHDYVKYKVYPFLDYKDLPSNVRDIALSLDLLRKMRDIKLNDKWQQYARDLFMLSFYLCGMNLADILRLDLTKDEVKFIRKKTQSRRNVSEPTEFTIQPEARALINKYLNNKNKLQFNGFTTERSIQHINADHLPKLRPLLGFDKLIFYSARKTFAQLANELMIKDSIIEYCIGDSPLPSNRALSFYVKVNKRMADKAIRKVFDAVASNKTLEQLIQEDI